MSACKRTYSTLCIYSPSQQLFESIKSRIGINPSRTSHKVNIYGWFLSSQDVINSTDVNDHFEYILNFISPKSEAIDQLTREGCNTKIFCYWESSTGNGGPVITPKNMAEMSSLNIELHFDIWFPPCAKQA